MSTSKPRKHGPDRKAPIDALAPPIKELPIGDQLSEAPRPLEWQALSIVAKKAEGFRDSLQPGLGQAVDVTLRIRGSIDVGNPTTARVKEQPKLDQVLGVILCALSKPIRMRVIELVHETFGGDEPKQIPAEGPALVKMLLERVTREGTQTKRGAVSGSLKVDVLARPRWPKPASRRRRGAAMVKHNRAGPRRKAGRDTSPGCSSCQEADRASRANLTTRSFI